MQVREAIAILLLPPGCGCLRGAGEPVCVPAGGGVGVVGTLPPAGALLTARCGGSNLSKMSRDIEVGEQRFLQDASLREAIN